jgi:hypothetical protein
VCLRVRATDLASEAGMGKEAMAHILQICGPERCEYLEYLQFLHAYHGN